MSNIDHFRFFQKCVFLHVLEVFEKSQKVTFCKNTKIMVLEVFTTSNHDVQHTTNVVGSAWNARPTPPWGVRGAYHLQ